MSFLTDVKQRAGEFTSENATLLLTVGGVVGTVATAVLAGRGGYKYSEVLREKQLEGIEPGESYEVDELTEVTTKDKVLLATRYFGPPAVTGVATIAMIITSHKMSSAKIAGLAAAYGLAERNLGEYKAKIAEKITGPKKTQIDDEIAQDQVTRTLGHEGLVIVDGEVLCFDRSSGRYFKSDMETIRAAVNKTNTEIHQHGYAQASDFYKKIGLPPTAWSDDVGFDMDNPIELTFSTVFAPGNKPCIAFEFVSLPKTDFGPKHH